MNIKKLLFIFTLIFISMSSISAVTNLTSCGKNTGWVSGETYVLDFTTIPSGYANSYCFYFDVVAVPNMTFIGTGDIDLQKDLLHFFKGNVDVDFENSQVSDISLISTTGNSLTNFLYTESDQTLRSYSNNNTFTNISLNLPVSSFYYSRVTRIIGIGDSRFNDNTFIEIFAPSLDYFVDFLPVGGVGQSVTDRNVFEDSYINTNTNLYYIHATSYFRNGNMTNSFLNSNTYATATSGNYHSFQYHDSIRGSFIELDADDNNIGDSSNTNVFNPKIVIQALGFNLFQDLNEGEDVFDIYADNNLSNVYIANEVLLDTHIGQYFTNPNGQPNEFIGTLIIEKQNNFIINGGIDCTSFTSSNCFIQDDVTYSAVTVNKFRGLLNVGGATIKNLNLTKVGASNSNLISNVVDTYSTGLIIEQNNFVKSDDRVDDDSNELLNLKANDLNINNNLFTILYTGGQSYEFLDIESTTPSQNVITENDFNQDLVGVKVNQQIFNDDADTTFYNNDLGANITISDTTKTNLDVNPLIAIEYLGSIYYFRIGNYYTDNVGCVDGDVNGICDSSYTSGAIVDDYPLASYPYNYLSHLGDAETVVVLGAFNITLNIPDNETFVLADLGIDTINLSFNHNSDFSDLVCSYILDGISILNIADVVKDIEHSIDVSSWTEKSYSYRVECLNEFIFQSSDEILFNVELGTGPDPGDGNETISVDLNIDLFSGDIGETGSNLQALLNLISSPVGIMIVLGLVFVGITLIGLLFAIARKTLG